jgi:hypothetical protein
MAASKKMPYHASEAIFVSEAPFADVFADLAHAPCGLLAR